MKLQRVEISEDERAELLTQHQQAVERYREEIERAASCQTAGEFSAEEGQKHEVSLVDGLFDYPRVRPVT